ncbi:MAG: sugar transferase [Lachnospiraceae bacterium]|nr:sugar transferase [Lachnospiraceae bacterium]
MKKGWKSFYAKHVKYTLSRIIGWTGIILFWWLFLIIAVLIRLDDPSGPALFIQDRVGQYGHVYKMYKFRTMKVGAEHTGTGVYSDDNDPRVTRLGRFLRAASLDELPQLINLAKGDMALIGFRSPLTYHPWPWSEYTKEQKKMFLIKPGITGWAQVHGRRTVEWHDRIRMNNWYADHVSFFLDIRIFFMTIFKVIENKDNENIGETVKKEK